MKMSRNRNIVLLCLISFMMPSTCAYSEVKELMTDIFSLHDMKSCLKEGAKVHLLHPLADAYAFIKLLNFAEHVASIKVFIVKQNADIDDVLTSSALIDDGCFVWTLEHLRKIHLNVLPIGFKPRNGPYGYFCVIYIVMVDASHVPEVQKLTLQNYIFPGGMIFNLFVELEQELAENIQKLASPDIYNTLVITKTDKLRGNNRTESVFSLVSLCPHCNAGMPSSYVSNTWTRGVGFSKRRPLFLNEFKNLRGRKVRISTMEFMPLSCFNKNEDGSLSLWDNCIDTRLLMIVAKILNFTYVIREPKDMQWGIKYSQGNFSGVIGDVNHGIADFSLNVAISSVRNEVIDYTPSYLTDPVTFAVPLPKPLNSAIALVQPFEWKVWIAFIVALLLVGPIYYLLVKGSFALHINEDLLKYNDNSLVTIEFEVIGCFFRQSFEWSNCKSTRILITALLFFTFIFSSSYTAMLVSKFTIPTLSPVINTIEELVKSDFTWGVEDMGGAEYQLFKTSDVLVYKKIFEKLEFCPSLNECLFRARNTKFAFITFKIYMKDRVSIRFTSTSGERQLHISTNDYFAAGVGWATPPGSPLNNIFTDVFHKLAEGGIIAKWIDDMLTDPTRRDPFDKIYDTGVSSKGLGQQALGLPNLQGVFYILIAGWVVSFLIFLGEKLCAPKIQL